MKRALLTLMMIGASTVSAAADGFLFATFKNEASPMGEQIYFAVSDDGLNWEELNGGEPALISDIGTKGVRDPYLIRSRDGKKCFLIATDLSVNRIDHDWPQAVREGSRSIVIWESDDLVNWSEPRLVTVAPEGSGCAWAPEAVYDEENDDFLVFWASTSASDDFSKHRIWARRTQDFHNFGEPFIYIEKPTAVIDTTIVNEGDQYFRVTKDEADKNLSMESSPRVMGPWTEMPDASITSLFGYEGPLAFVIEPATGESSATWLLLLDRYSKGTGYAPFITSDIASGQFEPLPEGAFNTPFRFRHGSVLPVSGEELQRLKQAL